MSAIVIDTNVLLVADGQAPQMTSMCREECLGRLQRVKDTEQVVIDTRWIILREYHNKLSPNQSPTPGSEFLKWLLQVQADARHVAPVTITPLDQGQTLFAEFPSDKALEAEFDPDDRKFIAAANAHPQKPPVLESADSKWLRWEPRLKAHGICLEILCRRELEAIQERRGKRKKT